MLKYKIKEWEVITGIKLLNLKGFKGKRSKVINSYYTEKQYKKQARLCNIKCQTEKGLEFISGVQK